MSSVEESSAEEKWILLQTIFAKYDEDGICQFKTYCCTIITHLHP